MKKALITVLGITTALSISLTSCKKKADDATPATTAQEVTQASDQSALSDATNEVMNSVTTGLNQSSAARMASAGSLVSNATVKMSSNMDTLYINFAGLNEDNTRSRSGKITVYLTSSLRWFDKGAQWKVDFGSGLTVTRISDGKTVKLLGSKTVTNVTGGNVFAAAGSTHAADSVTHKISGNLQLIFDSETTERTWTISRTRTITNMGSSTYNVKFMGDSLNSAYLPYISETGTTRFGTTFVTSITSPLILEYCAASARYKFVSGSVTHSVNGKTFSVTYGVNLAGAPVTSQCDAAAILVKYTNASNSLSQVVIPQQ